MWRFSAWMGLLAGCGSQRVVDTPPTACDGYPANAVQPMELGAVLYPYSWPEARDMATGANNPLDLGQVPCDTDPDLEWSPFDALLFVSIPAW